MNAPFHTQRLHIAPQPVAPQIVAELFDDLEEAELEVRRIREQLNRLRQDFMQSERVWGLDLSAYRAEIMRRAGR
jgi:hypothetical protein